MVVAGVLHRQKGVNLEVPQAPLPHPLGQGRQERRGFAAGHAVHDGGRVGDGLHRLLRGGELALIFLYIHRQFLKSSRGWFGRWVILTLSVKPAHNFAFVYLEIRGNVSTLNLSPQSGGEKDEHFLTLGLGNDASRPRSSQVNHSFPVWVGADWPGGGAYRGLHPGGLPGRGLRLPGGPG